MSFLVLGLDLYFASILLVSGLAKVDSLERFEVALRRQRLIPPLLVPAVSRIMPWLEAVVAGVLISGIMPVATAIVVLGFFSTFLVYEGTLVITKRTHECGCYGAAFSRNVDGASVVASTILVSLAAFHLPLTVWAEPLGMWWRLAASVMFSGVACTLLLTVLARRQRHRRLAGSMPVAPV